MHTPSRPMGLPTAGPDQPQGLISDNSPPGGTHIGSGFAAPSRQPTSVHSFPVQFTGSGSEYFRIWIVNLLLMLVTLGLYYPWAKVRKLRYFYGHTEVAGHPLDFHGNPKQMLRGFLLMAALLFVYGLAGNVSDLAGGIAGLILAAVWPALLRASLQFRLAQTSWRGLRFAFRGSLRDAYLVFAGPMAAIAAAGIILAVALSGLGENQRPGGPQALALLLFVLVAVGVGPYLLWRLKAYQHNHYALGPWQTTFRATCGDVAKVFLSTAAVGFGSVVAFGAVVGLLAALIGGGGMAGMMAGLMMITPVVIIGMLIMQALYAAYFTAKMQNLVWTSTGNRQIRFKSHVPVWGLTKLMMKNTVLTGLTLGLYWPFAAVAMARLKLESVSVHTRQHPDDLVVAAQARYQDAAGDMAADLLGIDVGL
ncbi:DUF898 family protein [Aquabacterium fontiphilum]|uniref:YjgN family protein n=1 Tax=Aquabacterium fontiphilum TaxID=450365 RepID=UPI0013766AAE|nr:YjgN family protein [Aquabacterium fontiphilum]NBD19721.1 DUF898 family protein [Aquabacterium fontiphilum]